MPMTLFLGVSLAYGEPPLSPPSSNATPPTTIQAQVSLSPSAAGLAQTQTFFTDTDYSHLINFYNDPALLVVRDNT